ncbi:MAG: hypothetical protein PHE60_07600 [Sulfurospirillaceae bacterium]|nr:hypothetical protein [Sulfurospirillaceae bacterium]
MKIIAEITKRNYTITFKEDEKVIVEVKMLKIRGGAKSVRPIYEQEKIIDNLGFGDSFESVDRACFDAMCNLNQ